MQPIVLTIAEACAACRIGRTRLYELIGTGEIRAIKQGRRTLVKVQDLQRFIETLPAMKLKSKS